MDGHAGRRGGTAQSSADLGAIGIGKCDVVGDGSVENLLAGPIAALKGEMLDTASEMINDDYEKLLSLEPETATQ